MFSPSMTKELTRYVRTLTFIWLAFLTAPIIYGFIGWMIHGQRADAEPATLPPVVPAVLAVAGVLAAGALFLFSRASLERVVRGETPLTGLATAPVSTPAGLQEHEAELLRRYPAFQTAMILRWAGFESLTLLGLVAAVMGAGLQPLLIGAALSVGLTFLARPRLPEFLAACRRSLR
ncbi:MAG TPA: hypothetical protein PLH84_09760 [Candidatus Krumholzibacteria bacterium]|nr:hypothetical protein [Candidatus Krumholzibacteria bacterium]